MSVATSGAQQCKKPSRSSLARLSAAAAPSGRLHASRSRAHVSAEPHLVLRLKRRSGRRWRRHLRYARAREAGTARCASEQKDTQTQLAGGSHATPSPPRGPLTPGDDRSEPAGRPRRAHARALAQTPASSQGSRPLHPTPHVQRSPQSASLAPLARAAGTARTECVMPEKVGRGDGQRQVVRQRQRCDGDRSAGGRGSRLLRRGACSTLSAVSAVTWLRHGCCLLSLSAYAGTRPTAAVRGRAARLKGCLAGWPAALAACCRHSAASATQGAPGKVPRVTAQCTAVTAAAQLGGGWQAAGPRAARKSVWRRASEVAPGTHHVISVTHHVRAIVFASRRRRSAMVSACATD